MTQPDPRRTPEQIQAGRRVGAALKRAKEGRARHSDSLLLASTLEGMSTDFVSMSKRLTEQVLANDTILRVLGQCYTALGGVSEGQVGLGEIEALAKSADARRRTRELSAAGRDAVYGRVERGQAAYDVWRQANPGAPLWEELLSAEVEVWIEAASATLPQAEENMAVLRLALSTELRRSHEIGDWAGQAEEFARLVQGAIDDARAALAEKGAAPL